MVSPNRKANVDIDRRSWLWLAVAFIVTHVTLYWMHGIEVQEEASKYIEMAQRASEGDFRFSIESSWYAGYVAVLLLLKVVGLPVQAMYFLQLAVSFASMICFARIARMLTQNRIAVTISTFFYCICFIVQQWVCYLFTDGLFFLLMIITVYLVLRWERTKEGRLAASIAVLLIPFFRPVGMFLLPVLALYWFLENRKVNARKISLSILYFCVLIGLAWYSLTSTVGYFYPLHNVEANVICGVHSDLIKYRVTAFNAEKGVVAYLLSNPLMTMHLFFERLYKVFSLTRPYFSRWHNLGISIASSLYYFFALTGLFYIVRARARDLYFLPVGVLIFAMPSVLLCVEWHGRMSLPMFAFVLLMGVVGIWRMVLWFEKIRSAAG